MTLTDSAVKLGIIAESGKDIRSTTTKFIKKEMPTKLRTRQTGRQCPGKKIKEAKADGQGTDFPRPPSGRYGRKNYLCREVEKSNMLN